MENFKIIEWPFIEETPSCSSKEEINNLVLPDYWNEKQVFVFGTVQMFEIKEDKLGCMDVLVVQHLVVTAEKYVHDPGNRGHI